MPVIEDATRPGYGWQYDLKSGDRVETCAPGQIKFVRDRKNLDTVPFSLHSHPPSPLQSSTRHHLPKVYLTQERENSPVVVTAACTQLNYLYVGPSRIVPEHAFVSHPTSLEKRNDENSPQQSFQTPTAAATTAAAATTTTTMQNCGWPSAGCIKHGQWVEW